MSRGEAESKDGSYLVRGGTPRSAIRGNLKGPSKHCRFRIAYIGAQALGFACENSITK
jgi:hypothetical protein